MASMIAFELKIKYLIILLLRRLVIFYKLYSIFFPFQGLNGIDKKLLKLMPQNGVFIEVGANDGVQQSNSLSLEKIRGWNGVLIEPIPELYSVCRTIRDKNLVFNFALANEEIQLYNYDLMSSISNLSNLDLHFVPFKKQYSPIPCRNIKLSQLLNLLNYEKYTLLILDVEGSEIEVLKDIIDKNLQIEYILVETNQITQVLFFLQTKYILISKLSHHDYLFRKV